MARRNLGVAHGDLTFDQFAAWLREYLSVPVRKAIVPETQFDCDLGLPRDYGDALSLRWLPKRNFPPSSTPA